MAREVAIVTYAHAPMRATAGENTDVELLMPVIKEVKTTAGLETKDIDFFCSGSCDYMSGQSFSFVESIDALGAAESVPESHVEMDGAWALAEAWLKVKTGDANCALVYSFGKSSPADGNLPDILALQNDPYYIAPLAADSISLAALQANAAIESHKINADDMTAVVRAAHANFSNHHHPCFIKPLSDQDIAKEPMVVAPLRRCDCAPITDGASAMIIAELEMAKKLCARPVLLTAIDHRIESAHFGLRDLTVSASTTLAAKALAVASDKIEIAELHAPFSHQVLMLQQALGLADHTVINHSGGALLGNPMMVAGLDRVGYASEYIAKGSADRGLAHATSGPCLQHNMLLLLEGI